MYKLILCICGGVVLCSLIFSGCHSAKIKPSPVYISKTPYKANVSVHDPSIIQDDDGTYYIFGSHMQAARSADLLKWKVFATGVSAGNKLFDNLFTDLRAFEYAGKNNPGSYSVWAPDVIYNPVIKKYMMYFCTTSTYIKSNLCLAFADSVEGPYTYRATLIYSGFTPRTIDQTNVAAVIGTEDPGKYFNISKYNNMLWPNAIDPALFYDAGGKLWMSYGSWSGGIFILEIDQKTGLPIHPETDPDAGVDRYFGKHLAGGLHNSVEGPYIIYDAVSGYYYLFVSYGSLVTTGGYQIRLFRSRQPDGPYTDTRGLTLGHELIHKDFGLKLMGNYTLPSLLKAYMAPGHNSAIISPDNKILVVYHVRFDDSSEYHEPRVHQLFRTSNGWLTAAPFSYTEADALQPVTNHEIPGHYYLINHGTDIGSRIGKPEEVLLQRNGRMENPDGKKIGRWKAVGGMNLEVLLEVLLKDTVFNGVFLTQKDEAGNRIFAISAISGANESIWGIQYKQRPKKTR